MPSYWFTPFNFGKLSMDRYSKVANFVYSFIIADCTSLTKTICRLPSVPYLTSLDKYAIGSLLYLVLFCVWHSVIGSNVITDNIEFRKAIDSYVLIGSAILYFLYNFFYIAWFLKMHRAIKKFQNESIIATKSAAKSNIESIQLNKSQTDRNQQLNP